MKLIDKLKIEYLKVGDKQSYSNVCEIEEQLNKLDSLSKAINNFKMFMNRQINEMSKTIDKKDVIKMERLKAYVDFKKDAETFLR